jgi:hypothetical protein
LLMLRMLSDRCITHAKTVAARRPSDGFSYLTRQLLELRQGGGTNCQHSE